MIVCLFAGPEVLCAESIGDLFELGLQNKDNKDLIRKQMMYTKDHHTYVNRINGLLRLL